MAGQAAARAAGALLCLAGTAQAIYEDQAGVNEWVLQHVGSAQHLTFAGPNALVVSREGVVAAIGSKSGGELAWRTVLPENAGTEVASGGFASVAANRQALATLSKDGCTLRTWQAKSGGLLWDLDLCPAGTARGAGDHAAVQFGADVNSDKFADLAVLSNNNVQIVSTASGLSVRSTGPEGDAVFTGLLTTPTTTFALGRSANGKATVTVVDTKPDTWELPETLATGVDPVPLIVGGRPFAAVLTNTGKLVLHDIEARKSTEVGSPSGKTLAAEVDNVDAPLLRVGDALFLVSAQAGSAPTARAVATADAGTSIVAGGSSVVGDAASGSTVVATQASSAGNCGSIAALTWTTFAGQSHNFDLPEPVGQRGDRGCLTKLFVQSATVQGGGYSARIVAQFEDASLVGVQLRIPSAGATLESSLLYVREEALAEVVEVSPVELPALAASSSDDFAEQVSNILAHGNPVSILMFRLKDQLRAIRVTLASLFDTAKHYVNLLVDSQGQVLVQAYNGELPKGAGYSQSALAQFGFRKGLLALTKSGKVFLLNSLTGEIIYSVFDRNYSSQTRMFVTRPHSAGPSHPAEVVFVESATGRVSWRNALTGTRLREENHGKPILETMMVLGEHLHDAPDDPSAPAAASARAASDEEDVSPPGFLVALDADRKWTTFPSDKQTWFAAHNSLLRRIFLVHFDQASKSLAGYGLDPKGAAIELWSYVVPAEDEVLAVQKHAGGAIDNPGIIRGDGSVLVKYINPNLMLLATRNRMGDLLVTILDGVSGRVAKRFAHKQSTGPVEAVLYDNAAVYTFWNAAHKRHELASVALFEGEIGKRELNLWTPRDKNDVGGKDSFSSFDAETPQVVQRTFFTENAVRALGVSSTRLGITDRRVFFGLETGSLNMQLRQLLDARRPLKEVTELEKKEGLVQYQSQLPFIPVMTVSYNLTVSRIDKIFSIPTRLESTTLVLATGLDLFFARVMPSKGFDVLNEDFSYALLILLTGGLMVAAVVLRGLVRDKKLAAAWK